MLQIYFKTEIKLERKESLHSNNNNVNNKTFQEWNKMMIKRASGGILEEEVGERIITSLKGKIQLTQLKLESL